MDKSLYQPFFDQCHETLCIQSSIEVPGESKGDGGGTKDRRALVDEGSSVGLKDSSGDRRSASLRASVDIAS